MATSKNQTAGAAGQSPIKVMGATIRGLAIGQTATLLQLRSEATSGTGGAPEFDTNRAKCLICMGQASRLPLQQAQLGVLLGFFNLECGQHIRLALDDG